MQEKKQTITGSHGCVLASKSHICALESSSELPVFLFACALRKSKRLQIVRGSVGTRINHLFLSSCKIAFLQKIDESKKGCKHPCLLRIAMGGNDTLSDERISPLYKYELTQTPHVQHNLFIAKYSS